MNLLDLIGMVTWETAGFAAVTLILVEALKAVNMVKTGDIARVTTAIVAALLSGTTPEQSQAMTPVIIVIASAGYELLELIIAKSKLVIAKFKKE